MYISCHLDSTKADMYNALCAPLFGGGGPCCKYNIKNHLINTIFILNIGTTL